jgi:phosphate:Na+ symporter
MYNKVILPGLILLLSYGFWESPDFKMIAAGIAIFLFGMLSLEMGIRAFAGSVLEKILHAITDKLWKRLGFGIVTTLLMQSSSLLSVLVISFLSAGLLDLAAGMGIIFGANLGTTTGAWLVAGFGVKVNIAAYAMPMLVFGILLVLQKQSHLQGVGYILSGIGFLFLGIHYMKEGFEAFRESINLTEYAMPGLMGLLVYALLGVAVTVIIQSSDAMMVLIITALSVQQITYDNSLAMAIGANIGTTVTAIIGSLSANEQGKRLAGAHFLFNLLTAMIALVMIKQLMWVVEKFSDLVGIAAADYTLKLAAFHTLFNLIGLAVMLPFIKPMAGMLQKLFKAKPVLMDKPRYLNSVVKNYPDTVVEAVRQETLHLYQNTIHIILKTLGLSRKKVFSDMDLEEFIAKHQTFNKYDIDTVYERNIKGIYSAIIAFISQARISWAAGQSRNLYLLREASRNIVEAVKGVKHLQKNLCRIHLSHNHYVINEYNKIRLQLALLIRQLEAFRIEAMTKELPLLALDNLRATIEEQDQQMNQTIDSLIREQKISPEMGTSLINDSAYMYNIKQNLMKTAETVFVMKRKDFIEAERLLSLDKTELLDVINPDSSRKAGT